MIYYSINYMNFYVKSFNVLQEEHEAQLHGGEYAKGVLWAYDRTPNRAGTTKGKE